MWRVLRRKESGQSALEFALVQIPLLMTLLGVIETAFLMQSWVTTQHAAREGVRFAITGADAAGVSPGTDANRIAAIETKVDSAATGIRNIATDLTVIVRSWNNATFSGAATDNDPGSACYAVEVQVTYIHRAVTPFFSDIAPAVTMVARERMINETFSGCGT